jgi:hypothetical protein
MMLSTQTTKKRASPKGRRDPKFATPYSSILFDRTRRNPACDLPLKNNINNEYWNNGDQKCREQRSPLGTILHLGLHNAYFHRQRVLLGSLMSIVPTMYSFQMLKMLTMPTVIKPGCD